ncbi:class I SAM-dependent methyltransferase [Neolewinella litorea]|uniref:Class I SAM-dependent methyltransferase n=1 Tax=Neolewinella litorea TaxID=2562452 RepID=A0A4S4NNL6_9BACT|nr:class I SAM-dependent methyltransferase [Neolewinella litorea]THH39958.1 class I SAM-dependent methyltransferase [Neolewinella litorea]
MAKWWMKAVVQKAISFLPQRERVNFWFQRYVTRGVDLTDEHFGYKLDAARDHLAYYRKYGAAPPAQATALELGTGWYPIVPTLLFLAGFSRIVSLDIRNWLSRDRQHLALTRILDYHDRGLLADYLERVEPGRLAVLRQIVASPDRLTVAEVNDRLHLEARIMDATRLDFPDDSFDLICSNNTFEHIYPDVLRNILREFRRVVKPDGVMSHFIDLSDHFAHLDPDITIYNFLQFSRENWALVDNDIQPQNRLRWPDYRRMYAELDIPVREEAVRPGDLSALATVNVHPDIGNYSPEQLAISHGYLVS